MSLMRTRTTLTMMVVSVVMILLPGRGDADAPPLPCILKNGCVCNHSAPFLNPVDRQMYGSCARCNSGWTGPSCERPDVTCYNGGVKLPAASGGGGGCECPPQWSGPACVESMCINSRGGVGPYNATPPDPSTNTCAGCADGWTGLSCAMCAKSSACPGGRSCNTSMIAVGDAKQLQCDVTQKSFLGLLGGGRAGVGGRVSMSCRKDGGFGNANPNGTCDVAFYRVEPNDEYVDAFFFCSAIQCAMTVTKELADAGKAQLETNGARVFRITMQCVILFGCFVLVAFSFLSAKHRKRVVVPFAGLLLLAVGLFVLVMGVGVRGPPPVVREFVEYTCAATACRCADDPARTFTPLCRGSMFESQILGRIAHKISFKCDAASGECVFKPDDVLITVGLACTAAECVAPQFSPDHVAARTLMARFSTTTVIVCVTFLVGAGVTFVMRWFAQRVAHTAALEFVERFGIAGNVVGASEGAHAEASRGATTTSFQHRHHTEQDDDEWALESLRPPQRTSMPPAPPPDELDRILTGGGHGLFRAVASVDRLENADDPADEHHGLLSDSAPIGERTAAPAWPTMAAATTSRDTAAAAVAASAASPLTRNQRELQRHFHLDVSNLSYAVDDDTTGVEKRILNDITLRLTAGEAVALLGSSGAGKTTLLDILAGRSKGGRLSGELRLDGTPIARDRLDDYRGLVGYVAQEDALLPALTVRQTLLFAARLKLPTAFSGHLVNEIVDGVIDALKLRSCADTVVGDGVSVRGISGGEKRRVAIGAELVANPRILYLDEPTNSLDSQCALEVMKCIVSLAKVPPLRRYSSFFDFSPIIVFSIHQPSAAIFALFDRVVLLSRGSLLYSGDAQTALQRISDAVGNRLPPIEAHANPAELLLRLDGELGAGDRSTLIHNAAAAGSAAVASADGDLQFGSHGAIQLLDASVAFRRFYPNGWQQYSVLLRRSWATLLGSYHLIAAHAAVTFAIAGLLTLMYPSEGLDLPGALNRAGALTFLLLVVALVSLSSLDLFVTERKLFVTERENGRYGVLPFLAAKLVCDVLPLRIAPVVTLGALIYFPMGLRTDGGGHFLWFLLILALFSVAITLMVLCFSLASPNVGGAALIAAVAILWNFVFCGLLVQADTVPSVFAPFKAISPFSLAFEALLVNELDGQTCTFAPTDATGKPSTSQVPILCAQYLFNLGLNPIHFDRNVSVMILLTGVLTLLTGLMLSLVKIKR